MNSQYRKQELGNAHIRWRGRWWFIACENIKNKKWSSQSSRHPSWIGLVKSWFTREPMGCFPSKWDCGRNVAEAGHCSRDFDSLYHPFADDVRVFDDPYSPRKAKYAFKWHTSLEDPHSEWLVILRRWSIVSYATISSPGRREFLFSPVKPRRPVARQSFSF